MKQIKQFLLLLKIQLLLITACTQKAIFTGKTDDFIDLTKDISYV